MNTPTGLSSQLLARLAPIFTFDSDNPAIKKVQAHVLDGRCCQVLGPRRHLKSRLIHVVGDSLKELGTHHVVYLDLAQVDTDDHFFADLEARIRVDLPPLAGQTDAECQSAIDLQQAFERMAKANDRNVLLMIDHLEIAPPNLVASLLGAVRAAHVACMDQYGHLQAVVCGSLLLSQVALRDADRFEDISETVMVPDLSRAESQRLLTLSLANARSDTQLTMAGDVVDTLFDWTDGDPILILEAVSILSHLASISGRTVIDTNDVLSAIQEMHRAVGVQTVLIDETVRHIANDVRLLTVVRRLLEHSQPPVDSVDSQEMRTLLELSGVVARRNNVYRIKSAAWEDLLRARLGTGHVGRLYARAGDWGRAIIYLGQAQVDPAEERQDYLPELFAAIINAIHDSRDERQAFACLNNGLHAAYPERDLLVYALDPGERALKLVTSPDAKHPSAPTRISLSESDRPEVQACKSTEYSISLVNGATRLLYPLRPVDARGDPLGLISVVEGSQLSEEDSPWTKKAKRENGYQLWEEREVLLGFLRNALRALRSKQRFHELLDNASQRAELWRVLDRIKTLLHDPELSEETVWRVMLEGVTHGRGLRFNRAVLFLPDATGRLVARHAVGYADRLAAEAHWQRHPYTEEATDDWLANLVEKHRSPTPTTGELEHSLRGRAVALDEEDSLLRDCYRNQEPFHRRSEWERPPLPTTMSRLIIPADECVLVPLLGPGAPLGALYADYKFAGQLISDEYYRMLQNFVAQIALVVGGARVLTAERQLRYVEQTQREQIDHDLADLQELQRALQFNLDTTGNDLLAEVVQAELSKVCETALGTRAWLVRVCPRDYWQVMAIDGAKRYSTREMKEAPPDAPPDGQDVLSPRTLSFPESVSVGLAAYLRSGNEALVVAPVEVNGNVQATLYVELKPGSTVANREKVVERAANRLGMVIGQVQNVKVLQRLVNSSLRLTRDEPLEETLHNIVGEAMEVLGGISVVTLYAIDESDEIVLAAGEGINHPEMMKTHPPYSTTVVEAIMRSDEPTFAPDVLEKRPFRKSKFVEREKICSLAAFPLIAEGRRLGCMFFSYRRRHLFTEAEKSMLSLFAQLVAAELLYDRLDRELKKKGELEQYIVQGTLGNEFIHRLDGTIAGMADHIDEIDELVSGDPVICELLELLRLKTDGLFRLSTDIRQHLKGMREAKREFRPLGPFIEQTIEQLKREAPKHVRLSYHSELPPLNYAIDPLLFEMLLRHLISNAWEAIPVNDVGRVDVTLGKQDGRIRIAISDNGSGVSEQDRKHIFESSYSTKQSDKERGQGLTISTWITKLHGGQLALGPSDNTGTTFYFDLPDML